MLRVANALWKAIEKEDSYENSAKELLTLQDPHIYWLATDDIFLAAQKENIADKLGDFPFGTFVSRMCEKMTPDDTNCLALFLNLTMHCDAHYGEEMWFNLCAIVQKNPKTALAHFDQFQINEGIVNSLYCDIAEPEKQAELKKMYEGYSKDPNAKKILGWMKCSDPTTEPQSK